MRSPGGIRGLSPYREYLASSTKMFEKVNIFLITISIWKVQYFVSYIYFSKAIISPRGSLIFKFEQSNKFIEELCST